MQFVNNKCKQYITGCLIVVDLYKRVVMSTIVANQPINRYRQRHHHRHNHRLCLIVLAAALWLETWAALAVAAVGANANANANAVHIELRRRRSVHFNGIELDENALLEQLAGHERALLFGTAAAPEFKLVQLERRNGHQEQPKQQQAHTRGRRSTAEAGSTVEAELKLHQTPQLFDDNFIFIRRNANSTQLVEYSPQMLQRLERCFYRSSWAALDLCDEESVRGVFQQNSSNFVIQPLPARFGASAHVLYQARLDKSDNGSSSNANSQTIPLDSQLQFEPDVDEFNEPQQQQQQQQPTQQQQQRQQLRRKLQSQLRLRYQPRHHHHHQQQHQQHQHHHEQPKSHHHHHHHHHNHYDTGIASESSSTPRLRRHIDEPFRRPYVPDELYIETAIFVDSDLYRHMGKNYPTNTENELMRFVLAMINGVQLLYHHDTLGRRINFVLKRLEILPKDTPGLYRSSDVDIYLSNFCQWQKNLNPPLDSDILHYDHAVILTGLDLHATDKSGKVTSQVVGLAPVAGMCMPTSSCIVNEGKHFESVFVVAHEIGHNLGMRHDSRENNCDPTLHIMSPTLGSGKITWSKCSRSYLEDFLTLKQAECLFDRGHFIGKWDHSAKGKLPGERFDANQQCMLKFGRNSVHASSQSKSEICRDLHCQRERLTWTSHPALEGTECGPGMWCRGGSCEPRPNKYPIGSMKQLSGGGLVKPSYEKHSAIYAESSSRMEQLQQPYKASGNELLGVQSTWSDWGEASACDSSCLYGPSNRLREGSAGLRTYNRSCLSYPKRCEGWDRKFEACIAKQCYVVPVHTIGDFATNVCNKARKSDNELTGEGLQLVGSIEDSCKIFCRTKNNGTKSRRWTFPDGTTCRAQDHGPEHIAYCIAGRCEKFSCSNATDNFFKMDQTFCAYRAPRPQRDSTELESKQQPSYTNNISYRRNAERVDPYRNRNENEVAVRSYHGLDNHLAPQPKPYKHKVSSSSSASASYSNDYKYNYHVQDPFGKAVPPPASASLVVESDLSSEWQVESGCHSNCMTESMGVQAVRSRHTGRRNIQLCTHKVKPCERLQTAAEYAEQTCARYKLKVRGLSGHGSQISASITEPDRSCRVGCQDEHIKYRYYLVNGINGHFPIGTRCSQVGRRYCVDGKCLEFGADKLLLQQSHISLALFRSKREALGRKKRSFLYYDPVNITETISQDFLNNIVNSIIDFERQHQDISSDNIELSNPIHVSADELSNN